MWLAMEIDHTERAGRNLRAANTANTEASAKRAIVGLESPWVESLLSGQGGLFDRQGIGGAGGGLSLNDGDAGLGEGVGDLGFAKARGVVFEGQGFAGVVDVEAAEAVEIGKFAETLELFVAQGRMEFVGDFEKCHAGRL